MGLQSSARRIVGICAQQHELDNCSDALSLSAFEGDEQMMLEGKTALVTDGRGRIGRAIVTRILWEGLYR